MSRQEFDCCERHTSLGHAPDCPHAHPKPAPPPARPADTTNDILLRLAAIKAVKDELTALDTTTKAELLGQVRGRMGATSAALEDGAEAATVSVSLGKAAKLYVADERAFLAWVKENRPTAIVESVRSSDQDDILAKAHESGELPDGVEMGNPGERYVSVRQTSAQRAVTVEAWRRGDLPLPRLQIGGSGD